MNLKAHCKLCLVVRKEADGIHRYAHVGDRQLQPRHVAGLHRPRPVHRRRGILDDITEVFNSLTGYSNQPLFATRCWWRRSACAGFGALIEREIEHAKAGRPARHHQEQRGRRSRHDQVLYRASQAGVQIDLIVRGVCCLRPGIPGISDRIRVRSIVGRFLEHSRIYYFENGGEPEVYIGSADLMERNLVVQRRQRQQPG